MSNLSQKSPIITIKLTLSPPNFHFSDPQPPTLHLHLSSNSQTPITIQKGYESPFDPRNAMQHGAFPIYDITVTPPAPLKIQDLTGRVHRIPPKKQHFLTITPGETTTLAVAFTRGGSYEPQFRPEPWETVRRGYLLDANGNEMKARRSAVVCGCDGLEAGKRYRVTVATGKLIGRSWWWGTAAEVEAGGGVVATFEEDGEVLELPLEYVVQDGGMEFCVDA